MPYFALHSSLKNSSQIPESETQTKHVSNCLVISARMQMPAQLTRNKQTRQQNKTLPSFSVSLGGKEMLTGDPIDGNFQSKCILVVVVAFMGTSNQLNSCSPRSVLPGERQQFKEILCRLLCCLQKLKFAARSAGREHTDLASQRAERPLLPGPVAPEAGPKGLAFTLNITRQTQASEARFPGGGGAP